MFTDTKNLTNLTINATNVANGQSNSLIQADDDNRFKLKKMWKPIIRLMTRKSALAKSGRRDSNSTMPNNLNLNNASQYANVIKDTLPSLEDTSYMMDKLPLAEFLQTQQQQEQQQQQQQQQQKQYQTSQQKTSAKALEFISKASIDKAPLDTCTNCVHGRNCQHTQFHQADTLYANVNNQPQSYSHAHSQLHLHPLLQHNVQYFDAEDGCFVWCENTSDIDESALREWLWQNSYQFAENATMC